MPNESAARPNSLLVIGDPHSRRAALLRNAAQLVGLPCQVISYLDLQDRGATDWCQAAAGGLLRIEAPGSDPETTRLMLNAGTAEMERRRLVAIAGDEINQRACSRGEIVCPLQWFLGFDHILQDLQRAGDQAQTRWMNAPSAIALAFDKLACKQLWMKSDVPVAAGYEGIRTYDQLRAAIPRRHARIFVKLRYGYSAMGAVALEWRDSQVRAITSVETTWHAGRPRMYVSKRPRVLQREFDIAWLIDTLGMEEIVVEDWLPKARWNAKPFDLRIVVIGGKARHAVGRASGSPFTNLNLDAERIPQSALSESLGAGWTLAVDAAERAARQVQGAYYLGMDVLVRPCRRQCAVLEANAFGDYLPGLDWEGDSTYSAELRSYLHARDAA